MDTRARLAAGGAVAAVLVTAVIVVALGIRPYPDLPTIAAQPEPLVSGSLAHLRWQDRGPCLRVVSPSGEDREVRCEDGLDQALVWQDGRVVTRRWGPIGGSLVSIDPATGDLTVLGAVETEGPEGDPNDGLFRDRAVGPDGRRLLVDVTDGVARLQVTSAEGGDTRTLLALEGPRQYEFQDPAWSSDGLWVTVLDSGGRLIVLAADGSVPARIWADHVEYGAAVG